MSEVGDGPDRREDGYDQPLVQYSAWVADETFGRHAGYVRVSVMAGPRPSERIVPPAGEDHAFWATRWARRVEVSVSPKGRSARVWADGVEIPAQKPASDSGAPQDTEPAPGQQTATEGPLRDC
jgi:hypothetical protein